MLSHKKGLHTVFSSNKLICINILQCILHEQQKLEQTFFLNFLAWLIHQGHWKDYVYNKKNKM